MDEHDKETRNTEGLLLQNSPQNKQTMPFQEETPMEEGTKTQQAISGYQMNPNMPPTQFESSSQKDTTRQVTSLASSQEQPHEQQFMNNSVQSQQHKIQPLLMPEPVNEVNFTQSSDSSPPAPNLMQTKEHSAPTQENSVQQPQMPPNLPATSSSGSPQRAAVTKVKLTDELNIFDWFRTTDIINQIAEKARSSVDTVLTTLDPGMKEYLYSGGDVNIVVISDHISMVSPIRDAFQTVFGRATVTAARYNPPEVAKTYPIKLACGFDESITVAQEKIKKFRQDMSNVPQNQVVVVVQPTVVSVNNDEVVNSRVTNGLKLDDSLLPRWFLTYCMLIEDPVLGATMNSYSQLIPMDLDVVAAAREAPFPQDFKEGESLGFARSIDDLMNTKLNLDRPKSAENPGDDPRSIVGDDERQNKWLPLWAGLDEVKTIHELGLSLAHLHRRKWNDCAGSKK